MLIDCLIINKNVLLEVLSKAFEIWDWIRDSQIAKCFPHHYYCTCWVVVLKFRYQAVPYLSVGVFVSEGKRKRRLLFLYFHREVSQEPAQVPAWKLLCSLPFCLPYVKFSREFKRNFGLCHILSVCKEAQNYVLGDFLIFLMPIISLYSGNRILPLNRNKTQTSGVGENPRVSSNEEQGRREQQTATSWTLLWESTFRDINQKGKKL